MRQRLQGKLLALSRGRQQIIRQRFNLLVLTDMFFLYFTHLLQNDEIPRNFIEILALRKFSIGLDTL